LVELFNLVLIFERNVFDIYSRENNVKFNTKIERRQRCVSLSDSRDRQINDTGVIVSIQDLELALDGERRAVEEARQVATLLERKRIALQTELDDVRAMLDAVSSITPRIINSYL